jgi:hypothetical protein
VVGVEHHDGVEALTSSGVGSYVLIGEANIMLRKFAQYDRSWRGYTKGWPFDFL